MLKYEFPDYWDRRAITAIGAFDFANHQKTHETLRAIVEGGDHKFFSSTMYAISMLYSWSEESMTEVFAQNAKANPDYFDIVKFAASVASELGQEGFDSDGRGTLNDFHKLIAGVLFEAVLEMKNCRKLTLTNQSSRLSVIADELQVFVGFEIDATKDGGAATLATMTPHWFTRNDEDWDIRHVELVTQSNCAGSVVIENVTSEDINELHRDLSALYFGFRSSGELQVQLELEEESAWNLTLKALRPLGDMAHIKIVDIPSNR